MRLTLEGLGDREEWERAGIRIPSYDVKAVRERTKKSPRWVHFGIGNIFRMFHGVIADDLIASGDLDRGITCVETFDFDVVDRIYRPYDNLALCVTLRKDGSTEKRVIGPLAEALAARPDDRTVRARLQEIFANPALQLVTYTITEKGYALSGSDGRFTSAVRADLEAGPDGRLNSAMALTAALLYRRFQAGALPIALVSTDNVSRNGEKLREAVLTVAEEWRHRGFVEEEYLQYLRDESAAAFPWSMIDKITPRPSGAVAEALTRDGVEDMNIVITDRKTYIAPFVNAEAPQYLVVEDRFPNGRPPLEKAGVYLTDRATVNACERMKVTVCLNPIHTALAPYGCLLGIPSFAETITDPDLRKLADLVGPAEGMEVVVDPGILSPEKFLDECLNERFPNPYIPDTPQRIAVDTSQMVAIRLGVTIRAFVEKYGDARRLRGIPLAIAGWLRYLLAVDDNGKPFELSPDPMNGELTDRLAAVTLGQPDTLKDQLRPILSNPHIFGMNLYEAGIGDRIEELVREEISGLGAVRATLRRHLGR